jgi:hypothetical protein
MRRLRPYEYEILRRIRRDYGGSYCPQGDLDPQHVRALHELVKAKRLTVEANDGAPPRYWLTAQGDADAA